MGQQRPAFSIVIPTRARPGQLAVCLRAISRLCYPPERFEVIVVDDGSPTELAPAVAAFAERLDLTLLRQSRTGPAGARNAGAARARRAFLAFIDDDCAPAPDWLDALAARFVAAPDHAVGGRKLNALADNPYSTASQTITDAAYRYHNAHSGSARFLSSANLALPADRFRAIGGFDPAFRTSEDRELCDRWLQHGYRLTYAPEARVYHAHALTLGAYWRQQFSYGRGASRFHRSRARRGRGRFRPDPTFYLDLLRHPLRQGPSRRAPWLVALLLVGQAANAAGFFWEEAARRAAEPSAGPGDG